MEQVSLRRKNTQFFYSYHDKEHKFGTGFVVSKIVKQTVMRVEAGTPRHC
jgi:hypothetical protein